MEILVDFKLISSTEIVDLEDFGHDEHIKWSDLSEEEQNDITDSLLQQIKDDNVIKISVDDTE